MVARRAGLETGGRGGPRCGFAEGGRDAVLLRAALLESPLPQGWHAEVARGVGSAMPVTAADLMPGLQGAALGVRLKEIESRWLASDLRLTRSDFLD